MKEYFKVKVNKYVPEKDFFVYRPASLNNPKDNAVMFALDDYFDKAQVALKTCDNCLVFLPNTRSIPQEITDKHAIIQCADPKVGYCMFFRENDISYYPELEDYDLVNGAYIAKKAIIGENTRIFPGAYIGGEVVIGKDCYIGSGVKLMGSVMIGNNVIIRENSVLGADGLSTNRDSDGKALTMPQFGGIVIEDDVQIGALTVIGRGAIDNTVIHRGCKIDNSTFISHNVVLGEDTFVVGETIMFGSSSTGKKAYISGNSTIRDGRHIGAGAKVGMGSNVVKDVPDGVIVKGNPAK